METGNVIIEIAVTAVGGLVGDQPEGDLQRGRLLEERPWSPVLRQDRDEDRGEEAPDGEELASGRLQARTSFTT
jgi:hypothetical protein